jgi:hypothetical protein
MVPILASNLVEKLILFLKARQKFEPRLVTRSSFWKTKLSFEQIFESSPES